MTLSPEQLAVIATLKDPSNVNGYRFVRANGKNQAKRYCCNSSDDKFTTAMYATPEEAVYEYVTDRRFNYKPQERTEFPLAALGALDEASIERLRTEFYKPFSVTGIRFITLKRGNYRVAYESVRSVRKLGMEFYNLHEAAKFLLSTHAAKTPHTAPVVVPPIDLNAIAYLKDDKVRHKYRYVQRPAKGKPSPYQARFKLSNGVYASSRFCETPEEAIWDLYCKQEGYLPLEPAPCLGHKRTDNLSDGVAKALSAEYAALVSKLN